MKKPKIVKKFLKKFRSQSRRNKILLFVAVVAIVGFAYIQLKPASKNGYTFESIGRHDIVEVVSESGNISIAGTTDVFSPSTGLIEELYVQNGDLVGIDQELFKVKSTATEDEKASAYATLAAKQSALKTAEQTKLTLQGTLEAARQAVLDAQQGVDDKHDALIADPDVYSINQKDSIDSVLTSARYAFDSAEKKYVEADVAIQSAQAAVRSAYLAYESTKDRVVTSPTIGTVSNLSVGIGSSIEASGGTALLPALTLANFSSSQIILEVNESDIGKIEVGQSTTIVPDALKNNSYSGVVKRIDSIGQNDAGVITYNVYIDVLNADDDLKSGMTVDVDILTEELTNVLSVPNAAVKPYQGGKAVRILNHETGEIENIPVTIGVKGDEYTEIIDGVEEGTEIIISVSNEKVERSGGPFGF